MLAIWRYDTSVLWRSYYTIHSFVYSQVLDSMFAKARYLAKIGSWKEALAAFDEIIAKEKTSTGKKIDATMEKAKIALFVMVCLSVATVCWVSF